MLSVIECFIRVRAAENIANQAPTGTEEEVTVSPIANEVSRVPMSIPQMNNKTEEVTGFELTEASSGESKELSSSSSTSTIGTQEQQKIWMPINGVIDVGACPVPKRYRCFYGVYLSRFLQFVCFCYIISMVRIPLHCKSCHFALLYIFIDAYIFNFIHDPDPYCTNAFEYPVLHHNSNRFLLYLSCTFASFPPKFWWESTR